MANHVASQGRGYEVWGQLSKKDRFRVFAQKKYIQLSFCVLNENTSFV